MENPSWFAREPARYQQACDMLKMEQPRERVMEKLIISGMEVEDAKALVDEAWRDGRGERRAEGESDVRRGAGFVLGGLLATLFFSSLLKSLGIVILFWGAVLYGIYCLIIGTKKLLG
jgi:hypothetical protein